MRSTTSAGRMAIQQAIGGMHMTIMQPEPMGWLPAGGCVGAAKARLRPEVGEWA
ncbi:MAG: hypothetical protein WEA09_10010 [Gemmatimonadota bacterium]